jgi:Caspase domain/PsbP-like protein
MYELLKSLGYEILEDHKLIGYVKNDTMKDAIDDFFDNRKTKADDTLVFYYSGHGVPAAEGNVYLASSEIDPDYPRRRGYPFYELTGLMQNSVSLRVVTILDCCYSGSAKLDKGSKGNEEDAARLGKAAMESIPQQGQGKYILAASQATQEAYELKQRNHSIFTYFLLDGLRENERSVDRDGNVTPYSLGVYIYKAILNLPAKKRPKQIPTIKAEASGDVILARYPNLAKNNILSITTLTLPKDKVQDKEEYYRPKAEERKQQRFLNNPKILIPTAAVIIGAVTAFVVFGGGIIHQQSSPPFATTMNHPTVTKQNENTKWSTHVNSTYGVSINYPPNWNASGGYNKANDTDIFIAYLYPLSKNDEGEVEIHVKTLNSIESLSEYVSKEISSSANQKVIGLDTNVTLAGLPAYRLMYTRPQEGDPNIHWKHLQVGTMVKDKVYYIDYSNPGFFPSQFDLDLPTIQKMISSFEIKAQSANTSSCDSGYNEGVNRAKHDFQGLNGHGYDSIIRHGDLNFQFCYKRGYESVWLNISKQKSTGS